MLPASRVGGALVAIEFPEALKISNQMEKVLLGRTIEKVVISDPGASVFKWGFVNLHKVDISSQRVEKVTQYGDYIYLHMSELNLMFGDMIGKILYHEQDKGIPEKARVAFFLDDGAAFSYNPSLYGYCAAMTDKQMSESKASRGKSPLDPSLDTDYMIRLFAEDRRRIAKQMNVYGTKYRVAGVGNAYWHDILYLSGVHPQRKTSEITWQDAEKLLRNTVEVMKKAIGEGGRTEETDFFGQTGNYKRLLSKDNKEKPCSKCGTEIQVKNLLGSSSYYCNGCQK